MTKNHIGFWMVVISTIVCAIGFCSMLASGRYGMSAISLVGLIGGLWLLSDNEKVVKRWICIIGICAFVVVCAMAFNVLFMNNERGQDTIESINVAYPLYVHQTYVLENASEANAVYKWLSTNDSKEVGITNVTYDGNVTIAYDGCGICAFLIDSGDIDITISGDDFLMKMNVSRNCDERCDRLCCNERGDLQ